MSLETADFINELDENNPAFNDPVGRGDDHDRLIKHVLKTTFPAFTGAVTLSDAEINALPQDVTDAVAAAVADLSPHLVPTGAITMWSGSLASIPTGWQLCNGTNGTPDLRNRFVVGAGASYAVGTNGGSNTKTTSSDTHNHGGTQGHALTLAQMPSHSHGLGGIQLYRNPKDEGSTFGPDYDPTDNDGNVVTAQTQGSGQAHSHGISNDTHSHTVDVRPPYYALAYIMKTSTLA